MKKKRDTQSKKNPNDVKIQLSIDDIEVYETLTRRKPV
jgi:hypothetical protein